MMGIYLVNLVQPVFIGGQLSHEGLVLLPLAVEVSGLIIGHVLSCQHLLIYPQSQLQRRGWKKRLINHTKATFGHHWIHPVGGTVIHWHGLYERVIFLSVTQEGLCLIIIALYFVLLLLVHPVGSAAALCCPSVYPAAHWQLVCSSGV